MNGETVDLDTARAAGDWLLATSLDECSGKAWPEDAGGALIHTSLDNGAPGIGWFLDDLFRATGVVPYEDGAAAATTGSRRCRAVKKRGVYWFENRRGKGWLPTSQAKSRVSSRAPRYFQGSK